MLPCMFGLNFSRIGGWLFKKAANQAAVTLRDYKALAVDNRYTCHKLRFSSFRVKTRNLVLLQYTAGGHNLNFFGKNIWREIYGYSIDIQIII
jgi:hypothetical protein